MQKERNARLHVFAGKPALTGTARGNGAGAGALRRLGLQRVPDGRNGARPDYGSEPARPGLHRGRKSREDRERARKGRRKDPFRRRETAACRDTVRGGLRREYLCGEGRSLRQTGDETGDSLEKYSLRSPPR